MKYYYNRETERKCLSAAAILARQQLHQDIPVCVCGDLKQNLRCWLKVPGKFPTLKYVLHFAKPENKGIEQEQLFCHTYTQ